MPETPRTCTLIGGGPRGVTRLATRFGIECPSLDFGQVVEFVEKAPADAEREVVEKERDAAVLRANAIAGDRPDSAVLFSTAYRQGEEAAHTKQERMLDLIEDVRWALGIGTVDLARRIEVILAEHDRLPKEERRGT